MNKRLGIRPALLFIELWGAWRTRLLFALALAILLIALDIVVRRLRHRSWGHLAAPVAAIVAGAVPGLALASWGADHALLLGSVVTLFFMLNGPSVDGVAGNDRLVKRILGASFALPIVSELLIPRLLLIGGWRAVTSPRARPRWQQGAGRMLALGLVGPLLGSSVVPLGYAATREAALFVESTSSWSWQVSGAVDLSREDFAWVGLSADRRQLFACGDGAHRVVVFNADDLTRPPSRSAIVTEGNQFCLLDLARGRIETVRQERGLVEWHDAATLRPLGSVRLSLSDGEVFLAGSPGDSTLVVVSEDRFKLGGWAHLVDRDRMVVIDSLRLRPGFVLRHPRNSSLIVSHWDGRTPFLQKYDFPARTAVQQVPTDSRVDRIAFDPRRGRFLVASPIRSRILEYDDATWSLHRRLDAEFGVRAVAVDSMRDFVLYAGLVSGKLTVARLSDGQVVRRLHVGAWVRQIVLDEPAGVAFVPTRLGIFRVPYAEPIPLF